MTYHNLDALKSEIKTRSAYARELRNEARKTFGMDRWSIQYRANSMGRETRTLLLAYGYLRGKTLEQMESAVSDPGTMPSARAISIKALEYFRPQAESESDRDYENAKQALQNQIEADHQAWKKKLTVNRLLHAAERANRKVA